VSDQQSSGTGRREKLRSRGWSDDVDTRRARRPSQKIDAAEREDGGAHLTITPSWIYACSECGEERRISTEDVSTRTDCDTCRKTQLFEPLGELIYPEEDGNGRSIDTGSSQSGGDGQ